MGARDPAGAWAEETDADSRQMKVWVAFLGSSKLTLRLNSFCLLAPQSSTFSQKKKRKEFAMLPNEIMLKA